MSTRDTWCRHRTPLTAEHKMCKAGVDFHEFDGPGTYQSGRASLMPCLGECAEAKARCDKYSGYTQEEIDARKKMFRERLDRIGTIRKAIVASIKETGLRQGQISCPCCKTGTVGFSQASNGHVHARCSTENCASWME